MCSWPKHSSLAATPKERRVLPLGDWKWLRPTENGGLKPGRDACSGRSLRPGLPRTWKSPSLPTRRDRKSTRLNSSHGYISYAVFCLKKKIHTIDQPYSEQRLRSSPILSSPQHRLTTETRTLPNTRVPTRIPSTRIERI